MMLENLYYFNSILKTLGQYLGAEMLRLVKYTFWAPYSEMVRHLHFHRPSFQVVLSYHFQAPLLLPRPGC